MSKISGGQLTPTCTGSNINKGTIDLDPVDLI